MAARTKSKVTLKYKTKYRVRNWAAYEESLRRRGDIAIPPRRPASSSGPSVGTWQQREAALLRIDGVGRVNGARSPAHINKPEPRMGWFGSNRFSAHDSDHGPNKGGGGR